MPSELGGAAPAITVDRGPFQPSSTRERNHTNTQSSIMSRPSKPSRAAVRSAFDPLCCHRLTSFGQDRPRCPSPEHTRETTCPAGHGLARGMPCMLPAKLSPCRPSVLPHTPLGTSSRKAPNARPRLQGPYCKAPNARPRLQGPAGKTGWCVTDGA